MALILNFRRFDWPLFAAIFALSAIGFATIYSVDLSRGNELNFFSTQAVAFGLGLVVFFISASLHATVYKSYAGVFYFFSLLLLGAVLLVGATVRGTTGWFHFAGMSFQPAELAKAGLIIFLAWLIDRYGRQFNGPRFLIASGLVTALPVVLILLQPDLGSALLLFGIWLGLIFLVGTRARYLGLVFFILAVGFLAGWFFVFADYQKDRLLTFADPERDPLRAGYNVNQSMIAVGAGMLFGRGLGAGSQSQLHFLPEAQTDFIFSVVAEELGFVGAVIILGLFCFILWRLIRIARLGRSEFGAFLVLAIAILFFVQTLLNIGGAVGLVPITGVTLPFVSYGGSSLIINFFLLGIAESVIRSTA